MVHGPRSMVYGPQVSPDGRHLLHRSCSAMALVSRLQSYILIGQLIRHRRGPLAVRWTHEHVKVSSMFEDYHDYVIRVHGITV